MSAAVVAEQHPPPSSWTKARRFLSGKRKSSSSGPSSSTGADGQPAQPYHLEDDDAKDQSGRNSPLPPPASATNGKGKEPAAAAVTDAATQPAEQGQEDAALTKDEGQGSGSGADSPTAERTKPRRGSQTSVVSAPGGEGERDPPAAPAAEEDDGYGDAPDVIEFLHKGAPYFWLSNHFLIPIYYDGVRYSSAGEWAAP